MELSEIIDYVLRTHNNVNPNVLREMMIRYQASDNIRFIIVDELPEQGEEKVIYLVPAYDPTLGDIYEEYIWINGAYELLGHERRITIDDALSEISENPVQNRVVTAALNEKQETLVSGTNIKTINSASILGSGNIEISKSSLGLSNVDNTSDADKPVSTATQTALNTKQNIATLETDVAAVGFTKNTGTVSSVTMNGTSVPVSSGNVDLGTVVTSTTGLATETYVNTVVGAKQDTLVSGTNIKTINNTSILGSGDITVSGLPITPTAQDNGKVLGVVNGDWGLITPITATQSGSEVSLV